MIKTKGKKNKDVEKTQKKKGQLKEEEVKKEANRIQLKKARKKRSKLSYKNVGRKWFDGKNENRVIAKLEKATAIDATVEECLYYADISNDSYYRYLKANPDFRKRLAALRQRPVLKARRTIVKNIDQPEYAKWYLERKKKSEFSQRIDTLDEGAREEIEKMRKELKELFKDGKHITKR